MHDRHSVHMLWHFCYGDHLSFLYYRNTAPWGLARINQRGALSEKDASKTTYNYTYDMNSENGRGVDVYILGGSYWSRIV